MCELFDHSWKLILGFLLFLSIITLLLRVKFSDEGHSKKRRGLVSPAAQPAWFGALLFWGRGLVAITMLVLMVLAFACAGSLGDIRGIIPN